ncbi:MAG: AAA family ATPase [Planctomycetia bacterium]|nr:AAA family ATPase [Planctomycetia bacterium]
MLTGVPGLGRTLLVKSAARVLGLSFNRIQFTPDLLPTDITGTEVLQESADRRTRSFRFFKGPIFANLVLADEINRSPPRTQSALLEVMQERQTTVGGQRYALPTPFLLVATQNSLETEGVFPLPEAQMDRFLMAIHLDYPGFGEEVDIVDAATGAGAAVLQQVLSAEQLVAMQQLARLVPVVPSVKEYALALVRNTRAGAEAKAGSVASLLRWGSSPRGGQALIAAGKVLACVRGRQYVTRQDIRDVALPVLAHRLILSFRAGAQGTRMSELIDRLVAETDRQLAPPLKSRRWRDVLLAR